MNILVADDTKTEQFFMNRLLLKLGIKPDITNGGKDAIKLSAGKKYDIIFLDTDMPEPDGLKTCQRIKSLKDSPNLSTPIVYMGKVNPDLIEQGTYVIEKPVSYSALNELLGKLKPGGKEVFSTPVEDEEASIIDRLKDSPDINVSDGVTHCGSEEGYIAALEIFYSTIEQKADEIQTFYDNEDYESYTIKVHALKSSARIIGANELADAAFALEMAGKDGEIDTIRTNTDELLSNYRKYTKLLGPLVSNDYEEVTDGTHYEPEPNVPEDVLADAYKSIQDFSSAMDFDLTEMVLKSLDEYILPKEDAKKVANIRAKLLNLDYDGILEILGETIQ